EAESRDADQWRFQTDREAARIVTRHQSPDGEVFTSKNAGDQRCRLGCLSRVFAGLGREKKGGFWRVRGLGLELFGWAVGYESLAGCDSVDAAYLLNGLFQ